MPIETTGPENSTGDALRRLADVVDSLQDETPIDVNRAQLLEATDDEIAADLSVTIPADADLQFTEPEVSDVDVRDLEDGLSENETKVLEVIRDADGEISGPEIKLVTEMRSAVYNAIAELRDRGLIEDRRDPDDGRRTLYRPAGAPIGRSGGQGGGEDKSNGDRDGSEESDPSTEDDTDTSESKSESEAPTVDLEEADADDSPAGTGDDVQDESEREEDGEDEAESDLEPVTVDAVDRDEDDEIEVVLPEGVTEDDVREAAKYYARLGDVAEEIDVSRGRARTITLALGCYGDVKDVPKRGGA